MSATVAAANEFPREAAGEKVLAWMDDFLRINEKFNWIIKKNNNKKNPTWF